MYEKHPLVLEGEINYNYNTKSLNLFCRFLQVLYNGWDTWNQRERLESMEELKCCFILLSEHNSFHTV